MDEMTTKWLISNSGSTSLTVQTFFRFHLRILCFQLAVEESTVKSSSTDIRPNSARDISSRNLNYLVVEPTHLGK